MDILYFLIVIFCGFPKIFSGVEAPGPSHFSSAESNIFFHFPSEKGILAVTTSLLKFKMAVILFTFQYLLKINVLSIPVPITLKSFRLKELKALFFFLKLIKYL